MKTTQAPLFPEGPDSHRTYKFDSFQVEVSTLGMKKEEVLVLNLLEFHRPTKLHQRDIRRLEPTLGFHQRHEADLPNLRTEQTTLRNVRQIIRTLRIKYHAPILSEATAKGGYWIPLHDEEIWKFIMSLQVKAVAQALGFLKTYEEVVASFPLNRAPTTFFEGLSAFLKAYRPRKRQ